MIELNLPLILIAALLAGASPGPATLAIAGTSMTSGRRAGLALASGVTTGSFVWSVSAAFGLAAVMLANAWAFEIIRYAGAGYLLFLAYKSARSALQGAQLKTPALVLSPRRAYSKGLALHLTNPKHDRVSRLCCDFFQRPDDRLLPADAARVRGRVCNGFWCCRTAHSDSPSCRASGLNRPTATARDGAAPIGIGQNHRDFVRSGAIGHAQRNGIEVIERPRIILVTQGQID
ncbi:hypothetical protein SuNHUV7_17860 (plasmid) [Pseudoseohaeicola sp. NH-UV-7]